MVLQLRHRRHQLIASSKMLACRGAIMLCCGTEYTSPDGATVHVHVAAAAVFVRVCMFEHIASLFPHALHVYATV